MNAASTKMIVLLTTTWISSGRMNIMSVDWHAKMTMSPSASIIAISAYDESAVEDEPLIGYIKKNYSIEADLGVYVIMVRSD